MHEAANAARAKLVRVREQEEIRNRGRFTVGWEDPGTSLKLAEGANFRAAGVGGGNAGRGGKDSGAIHTVRGLRGAVGAADVGARSRRTLE